MNISTTIKTDCVYFPLDRPCSFHKAQGIVCTGCPHYRSVSVGKGDKAQRILIIKLGAMGDVLRTTFILEGLKEKYRKVDITWLTKKESEPIVSFNPYVSRVIISDEKTAEYLAENFFDEVINLDLAPESLGYTTIAQGDKKTGFYLDGKRRIVASNSYALRWLRMSASDEEKKSNRRTYQWWMSKIVGLRRADYEIYVPLLKSSLTKAEKFSKSHNLKKSDKVIGLNPGAGSRWRYKKWNTSGYIDVAKFAIRNGWNVLLYGGGSESSLVNRIKKAVPQTISVGTNHNLCDFFALLNLSDVVITGDTLALHASLGLKKKVIAIFGPTSAPEIEIYNRGIKIITPLKCAPCYLPRCSRKPDCMSVIKSSVVKDALVKILSR